MNRSIIQWRTIIRHRLFQRLMQHEQSVLKRNQRAPRIFLVEVVVQTTGLGRVVCRRETGAQCGRERLVVG